MRNLHILSTEKPSRLQLQMNGNFHIENGQTIALRNYQNIYITSDEEINGGDYVIRLDVNIVFIAHEHGKPFPKYFKKIILTTDQDLIKDGVQEIDDEFLEWFVKNPSCERVRVDKFVSGKYFCTNPIISKEETKPKTMFESLQEYLKNTPKEKVLEDWNEFQHLDNEGITVKEFLENQKQTDEKEK